MWRAEWHHMASSPIPRPTGCIKKAIQDESCCAQLQKSIWYIIPHWSNYEFPCVDLCLSQSFVFGIKETARVISGQTFVLFLMTNINRKGVDVFDLAVSYDNYNFKEESNCIL